MSTIDLEKILAGVVETSDSQLEVKMPNQKLEVGTHRFQLIVEDEAGNQSTPTQITVIIADSQAPTAVLDLHDASGRTVTNGRINFGAGFMLSGKRSVDIGGRVSKYIWEIFPR